MSSNAFNGLYAMTKFALEVCDDDNVDNNDDDADADNDNDNDEDDDHNCRDNTGLHSRTSSGAQNPWHPSSGSVSGRRPDTSRV